MLDIGGVGCFDLLIAHFGLAKCPLQGILPHRPTDRFWPHPAGWRLTDSSGLHIAARQPPLAADGLPKGIAHPSRRHGSFVELPSMTIA